MWKNDDLGRFIFQIKPWYSYYPGPYWQDFYDDYDMINDIDLMKNFTFWNFRIGILVSHIYHIFIFYVPWHPNLAPMSVGLSLNQWPGGPHDRAALRSSAWKSLEDGAKGMNSVLRQVVTGTWNEEKWWTNQIWFIDVYWWYNYL